MLGKKNLNIFNVLKRWKISTWFKWAMWQKSGKDSRFKMSNCFGKTQIMAALSCEFQWFLTCCIAQQELRDRTCKIICLAQMPSREAWIIRTTKKEASLSNMNLPTTPIFQLKYWASNSYDTVNSANLETFF